MVAASSRAALISEPSGASRLTRPSESASSASTRRPVSKSSIASGARQPPRQALDAARVGDDAEADLRQRESGALGRDDEIAGEREFKSAAEGEAIDRGDDRLVEIEELGQAGEAARAVIGARALPFRRGLQIPSSAKEPIAGACQDGDASLGIVVKSTECKIKRTAGRRIDGVGLGPVERHLDDCAAPDDANGRCQLESLLVEADQRVDSDCA